MKRKSKTGARNVYRYANGKYYAKVTKDGKTYKSPPLDHFAQADQAASELRKELNI